MTTVRDYLNFFIFGRHTWSEVYSQSPSVIEKQLNAPEKAMIRAGKGLYVGRVKRKDFAYEVADVIVVTDQAAVRCIKACTQMQRAANCLRAAVVVVISLATLAVVRSRSPYLPFVLLVCSIAGFIFISIRHSQAGIFFDKASAHIGSFALTILVNRIDFGFGAWKTLSSPIFHHLEAECKVKDQITSWLTQLGQLP